VIRKPLENPIIRRYEESKGQFEACLREHLKRQKEREAVKNNMSLDNYMPTFSKYMTQQNVEAEGSETRMVKPRLKGRSG